MDTFYNNLNFFISPWEDFIDLLLAAVLGGVLGWEREARNKPAGLRTFMLVSLGSAAFMLVSTNLIAAAEAKDATLKIDPTRVMQGIIGGLGFIGGGTILQTKGSVKGITTAAGVWVAGAIGMACGLSQYGLAIMIAAFAFLTMTMMFSVEKQVRKEADVKPEESRDERSERQEK